MTAQLWSERITDADGDELELTSFSNGDIELCIHGPSVILKSHQLGELCEILNHARQVTP